MEVIDQKHTLEDFKCLLNQLYVPCKVYNAGSYEMKHKFADFKYKYVIDEEFIETMTELGYKHNSKNQYKFKIRKK